VIPYGMRVPVAVMAGLPANCYTLLYFTYFYFEFFFSNFHSHGECLWQVSLKSVSRQFEILQYSDIGNVSRSTEVIFALITSVAHVGMYYAQNTFSKNGENTIVVRQGGVDIGQRRELSVGDIVQTRLLYNCPSQSRSFLHIYTVDLYVVSAT